ncbi:hypothetical protein APR50_40195 [Variovorax paradoxus]|jgi:DNA-binding IclR family transcriptional regulator|uniref:IclR family transcriptional regulator n=1 Tax=Variovorax TaxID=34072 RepID=UPI0006E731B4|nr:MULTISPECIES: IclR family transcriptional regulator [unclassified Variovorax]KPU90395.1 hypothetical protein APR52_35350 [Variovorax paradoxus]KPU91958.1 hypothetical protein APR50_40195 [Variovorax paradoxus]KPU98248.1 hypothetical protein APR49_35320 [Variovorax paradoxus]KPV15631.1 hypothetical protein APR51_33705 [Variovorax paradoxus]KPV23855.1 hypothetical protein APR48_35175 [Variovorax paradoxus]
MDAADSKPPESAAVKSADRVLDILQLLARQGGALTHHEIGIALGIPKSSLTHLLRNLVAREFLGFDGAQSTYALGPAVFELVRGSGLRERLMAQARPIVDWLARTAGEATSFSVLRGDEVERACVAESRAPLSYRMAVGDSFPLYSTSAGKAILAAMPAARRQAYLKNVRLQAQTPATATTLAVLKRQLEEVGESGIAYSRGEHTPGVVGIAIAIDSGDPAAPAAFNIVVPDVRYTPEFDARCVELLGQARERFHAASPAR